MSFKDGTGAFVSTISSASATDKLLIDVQGEIRQIAAGNLPGDDMLSPTGVSAGTYGSGTSSVVLTIDANGRITAASEIANGITSVGTLTNVSAPSPAAGQVLVFSSGEWIASSEYLTSASVSSWLGALAFDDLVSAGTLDNTGVSAGTYGTATLIPQVQVDANGRIVDITRVTAAGGGGGATVSALTDILDVSASSLAAGDIIVWDAVNSEWNPQPYLAVTTAEVSTIVEAYGYLTSAITTAQVSGIVEAYGYITSAAASVLAQALVDAETHLTSADVSTIVEAYGYITSASASSMIASFDYITSASVGATFITSASLGALAFYDTITSSGLIDANSIALADIAQVSAKTALGNITGSTADVTEISILDEDNMASNSDTALTTQQAVKSYVDTNSLQIRNAVHVSTTQATIEFTGIPAGTKHIILGLNSISTNASSGIELVLGTSSGYELTGYRGAISRFFSASLLSKSHPTDAFTVVTSTITAYQWSGQIEMVVVSTQSGSTWSVQGTTSETSALVQHMFSGAKTTFAGGARLDRLKLQTQNGTDLFDNGYVNIMYE